MFCPNCCCEYIGLKRKCPSCKTPMTTIRSYISQPEMPAISYNDLIELVKNNNNRLAIDLVSTEVVCEKKYSFPYQGYGFAWMRKMSGCNNYFQSNLITTETSYEKKHQFPYQGYGYAWEKTIKGTIGGNELILNVTQFKKEKKYKFPYQGYGFAWSQELIGECGNLLKAHFVTTEVGKYRRFTFPYLGYGYAWIKKATLILSLE